MWYRAAVVWYQRLISVLLSVAVRTERFVYQPPSWYTDLFMLLQRLLETVGVEDRLRGCYTYQAALYNCGVTSPTCRWHFVPSENVKLLTVQF